MQLRFVHVDSGMLEEVPAGVSKFCLGVRFFFLGPIEVLITNGLSITLLYLIVNLCFFFVAPFSLIIVHLVLPFLYGGIVMRYKIKTLLLSGLVPADDDTSEYLVYKGFYRKIEGN